MANEEAWANVDAFAVPGLAWALLGTLRLRPEMSPAVTEDSEFDREVDSAVPHVLDLAVAHGLKHYQCHGSPVECLGNV